MKLFDLIITKFQEVILSSAVLLMAVILIGGVIMRTVFNSSLAFTEELGIALSVLVTFFAIGYCAREARHINMSVVFDFAPPKMKKAMMILISFGTAIIMAWLVWLSIQYIISTQSLGRVTPALRIPYWITIIPLPLGFGLAALEYTRIFILNITQKDLYISSKYRMGENTDEALGLSEGANETAKTGEVQK